jgi:hypothetical protein
MRETVVGEAAGEEEEEEEERALRWTGWLGGGWKLWLVVRSGYLIRSSWKHAPCMRVLTMSSGCTIRVAMDPAESPATVSTRAGERPASFISVIETSGGSRYMGPVESTAFPCQRARMVERAQLVAGE